MSSIKEILSKKNFGEPTEILAIKQYVKDKFDSDVSIKLTPSEIVIGANNAALAGTLQLHQQDLIKVSRSNKRIVIRIS